MLSRSARTLMLPLSVCSSSSFSAVGELVLAHGLRHDALELVALARVVEELEHVALLTAFTAVS